MNSHFRNPDAYKEGEIIISAEAIDERINELALQLANVYRGKQLLIIGLLTGAVWLTVDLLERLHASGVTDAELTFMKSSRYQNGTIATCDPRIEYDIVINPQGRNILLVDDIVDTGKTLFSVIDLLKSKDIETVKSIVLLDKPSRREVEYTPDYVGFEIPNIWVQGRGMDSDGYGRGDPAIRKGPYHY
ncbi:MAG TPA: phosphoribosyltransferase family protein [Candidatus Sulfotelmatobacter sp.]|jgi:hypoxanthine phosphoribosyltransferase|nr:phosphoribosyltransferase family protein [Candidatus Sulfotelmatobacter sp.]